VAALTAIEGGREGYADLTGVRLHYVEAGEGPLVVLLHIWGERDRYLGAELAEPDPADVPNLERVVRLPEASHWVQHDEPERVTELLREFFAAPSG
jgi:pimeloyl-ACP methyl ester carboxylesterase